jgi:hypothetical protein
MFDNNDSGITQNVFNAQYALSDCARIICVCREWWSARG